MCTRRCTALLLLILGSLLALVNPIVICLQIEVTEFVSNEQVTICINESPLFICLESAGNTSTLPECHYFLAVLTIKDGVISYLMSSFGRAVAKKFLFDSGTVKVAQKLVSPIFEFFELSI